jgi:phage baseplate assembly protein W
MAYVLNKKLVRDTEEFNDYAYGILLPVQKGDTGYFRQGFESYEQAKSNLKNLLLTRRGERIMQPEFGSGLHELLFEQATDDLEERLQETIENTVGYWLPYINIDEVDIEMSDELKDQNRANMTVRFKVGTDINTNEITFTIQG